MLSFPWLELRACLQPASHCVDIHFFSQAFSVNPGMKHDRFFYTLVELLTQALCIYQCPPKLQDTEDEYTGRIHHLNHHCQIRQEVDIPVAKVSYIYCLVSCSLNYSSIDFIYYLSSSTNMIFLTLNASCFLASFGGKLCFQTLMLSLVYLYCTEIPSVHSESTLFVGKDVVVFLLEITSICRYSLRFYMVRFLAQQIWLLFSLLPSLFETRFHVIQDALGYSKLGRTLNSSECWDYK